MADYCTVEELKAEMGIGLADTVDDSRLAAVADTVSRFIEGHCRQRFYTTAVDEARYFRAERGDRLWTGPLISMTTLATDEDGSRTYATTWAATDYDLTPYNNALDGKPYFWIEVSAAGRYGFPMARRGVRVIGKFGWSTVPAKVKRASLLQCNRIFKRSDAPFGVLGSAEMGYSAVISQLDPDVARLLDEFVL